MRSLITCLVKNQKEKKSKNPNQGLSVDIEIVEIILKAVEEIGIIERLLIVENIAKHLHGGGVHIIDVHRHSRGFVEIHITQKVTVHPAPGHLSFQIISIHGFPPSAVKSINQTLLRASARSESQGLPQVFINLLWCAPYKYGIQKLKP